MGEHHIRYEGAKDNIMHFQDSMKSHTYPKIIDKNKLVWNFPRHFNKYFTDYFAPSDTEIIVNVKR